MRKLLHLAGFFALATVAVLAVDRMGRPSIASLFLWAVVVATAAGAPGLVHRRAWPVALVLLPLGALLLMRAQMPLPEGVDGLGDQLAFYGEQLRSGARTYAGHGFPMDLTTAGDLKLLLTLAVYVVVWLAAFAALSLRTALPAVVVLLVPLGFGMTVDRVTEAARFPLAFVFLAACLLLSSRALRRARWGSGDTYAGLAATAVAAILAVWAVGATSLAASEPWRDWRAWDIAFDDGSRLGFDSMEGYAGLLDPDTNAQVMRVQSPVASYWRANALEEFDGTAWFTGGAKKSRLDAVEQGGTYTYTVPAQDPVFPGTEVRQYFEIRSMETDYFFTGGAPETLALAREVPVHTSRTFALGVDRPLDPGLHYGLTAIVPELGPADLVGRGRAYPQDVLRLVALPFPTPADGGLMATETDWRRMMESSAARSEWLGLYALNREIVGDAVDPYEIALRTERYLRRTYTYTLAPPRVREGSPYAAFLLDTQRGFCQHFAGAMAVLLRFNGIPARVAVGFATGMRTADGAFIVSRNDAHAWVEVYFPQVGWVSFEPTPGQRLPGRGGSSTCAGFADPFAQLDDIDAGGTSAAQSDFPRSRRRNPLLDEIGAAAPVPTEQASLRALLPWAIAAGLVVLTLAWPLARALWRRRRLRGGDADCRLRAALALVRADLADFGVGVPRSQTLDETAQVVKTTVDLDARAVVDRAQAVLFGGRAATDDDLSAVAAFRRDLRRRLRARAGRRGTILALYGLGAPASAPVSSAKYSISS